MESAKESASLSYPDLVLGKIFNGEELARLQNLIQRHEKTIRDLDPQLEEAQRDYDIILQSPEDHRSETMTSSIDAIGERLRLIEDLVSQARADLKILQGPINPIPYCPTDVLLIIFEWTMIEHSHPCAKRMKYVTNLSHVCYRWREVALNTSKFWTFLEVSLEKDPDAIESFWARSVERLRMCPARVRITCIDEKDSTWENMKRCRLDLIPNISSLGLRLDSDDAAKRLTNDAFYAPTGQLKALKIESSWANLSNLQRISVDGNRFLSRFSNFSRLELEDLNFINFTATTSFPKVSNLTIRKSSNICLGAMAEAFPNADTATFTDVTFCEYRGGDITWPELRVLIAYSTENVPWIRLKLPNITAMYLPEQVSLDGLLEFLPSHPSLFRLHVIKLIGGYPNIAVNAPQLVALAMPASESKGSHSFPNLVNLQLFQTRRDDLSSEDFEEIVHRHFLPSTRKPRGAKKVEGNQEHPLLRISIPLNRSISLHWRFHPLLSSAVMELYEVELWGSSCRSYHIKWE